MGLCRVGPCFGWSISLFLCLSVHMSVCPCVCLSVILFPCGFSLNLTRPIQFIICDVRKEVLVITRFQPVFTRSNPFSPKFTHFHPFPPVVTHFHPLSYVFISCYPFSSIFTRFPLYRGYYLHTSRDFVSPVCMIFLTDLV